MRIVREEKNWPVCDLCHKPAEYIKGVAKTAARTQQDINGKTVKIIISLHGCQSCYDREHQ